MDKIIKGSCHSCLYRHRCNRPIYLGNTCKYWKLGKCYTCKFVNDDDNLWFQRGCETHCFGGCKQYKRNWNETFKLLINKIFKGRYEK